MGALFLTIPITAPSLTISLHYPHITISTLPNPTNLYSIYRSLQLTGIDSSAVGVEERMAVGEAIFLSLKWNASYAPTPYSDLLQANYIGESLSLFLIYASLTLLL